VSSAAQFKMAAVLDECTLEEQRAVVRFFVGQRTSCKVYSQGNVTCFYGEKCLSRKAVHNWVDKFAQGRSKVVDEHRSGHPLQIAPSR
jgi:hypothetical protein